MREKLINALINLASDELDEDTLIAMAKESEEQLVDRLIHIANFYFMEYEPKRNMGQMEQKKH